MNAVVTTSHRPAEGGVKSVIAWGSIAYACGFVTVMLHTARLGFPVLELLSAIYIWIGAPLALVSFFGIQIANFFRHRAGELAVQFRQSWDESNKALREDDLTVISQFVGVVGAIVPAFVPLHRVFELLLKKMAEGSETSRKALNKLHVLVNILRGIDAVLGFIRLAVLASMLVFGIYLYVWMVYPLIPQSLGGGAPSTVRLIVSLEKVPPEVAALSGIPSISDSSTSAAKTAVTGQVLLLYISSDHYFVEGPGGQRLSLSSRAVEGVVWTP